MIIGVMITGCFKGWKLGLTLFHKLRSIFKEDELAKLLLTVGSKNNLEEQEEEL